MNGELPVPLAELLRYRLSQPPSRAGARLLPERRLAQQFGVNYMRLRRTLDELVEEGLLVRRHGSGVYVRKVPRGDLATDPELLQQLPPINIFAKDKRPTRLQPDPKQVRLHLGLWTGHESPDARVNATHRGLERGITERVKERGHRLTIHRLGAYGEAPTVEELAAQIRDNPHDGYVVFANWAPLMEAAFGETQPPCAYIGYDPADEEHQPMILIDVLDAVGRAVRRLAACGYRRIGLIGLEIPGHPPGPERAVYERAMEELGLSYRAVAGAGLDLASAAEAVRQLFARPDPPEAVYVADDVVLAGVALVLPELGLVPGRNLGLITLACVGNPLPAGVDWSRMEFNPVQVGRMTVDSLLLEIETAGQQLCSFAHRATWRPGQTHRMSR